LSGTPTNKAMVRQKEHPNNYNSRKTEQKEIGEAGQSERVGAWRKTSVAKAGPGRRRG